MTIYRLELTLLWLLLRIIENMFLYFLSLYPTITMGDKSSTVQVEKGALSANILEAERPKDNLAEYAEISGQFTSRRKR
jgi:hypothetical protein